MARLIDDGASEHFDMTDPIVTAAPFTVSLWVYPDDLPGFMGIWAANDVGSDNDMFGLLIASSDELRFRVRDTGSSESTSSSDLIINTWNHCVGVEASVTSHTSWLNGVASTTSTTSRTPNAGNIDVGTIGAWRRSSTSLFLSGRVAEFGIWSVALTDAEIIALSNFVSPQLIRPDQLLGYTPFFGAASEDDRELIGQRTWTDVNGIAVADHPGIFYPASPSIVTVPAAAITDGEIAATLGPKRANIDLPPAEVVAY